MKSQVKTMLGWLVVFAAIGFILIYFNLDHYIIQAKEYVMP